MNVLEAMKEKQWQRPAATSMVCSTKVRFGSSDRPGLEELTYQLNVAFHW